MKISKTIVVGAGGTGSHLIVSLSRLLCFHEEGGTAMCVIDGDEYEAKNAERQSFNREHLGMNKAEVAAMQVWDASPEGNYFPDVCIEYLKGPESMHPWLFNAQKEMEGDEWLLIVPAVDNDVTRMWIYEALEDFHLNVIVVDPANELDTGNVTVFIRTAGGAEPFLHPFKRFSQLKNPKDRPPGGGCAKETVSHPQLITANMMAATYTLQVVTAFLNNDPVPDEISYDLKTCKSWAGEWLVLPKEAHDAEAKA